MKKRKRNKNGSKLETVFGHGHLMKIEISIWLRENLFSTMSNKNKNQGVLLVARLIAISCDK